MTHARHVLCLGLMALLAACGSDAPAPAASGDASKQAAQPKPAAPAATDPTTDKMARAVGNGKPGAAVDIKYEFASKPEPGKPVQLEVALIPSAGVDSLDATFSGMEGITLAGPLTANLSNAKAGEPYKHSLSVLANRNGVFYITVSVNTQISGATLGRTFSIPFVAGNPAAAQEKPKLSTTDGSGQAVKPMKAQESTNR
ncbi:MAG: hypothetical protein ACJ8OJ_03640 [Povalibacter sp.]